VKSFGPAGLTSTIGFECWATTACYNKAIDDICLFGSPVLLPESTDSSFS